jgi:hypothetical protein
MIRHGFKGAHLKQYIAAFTLTGNNLSADPLTAAERAHYEKKKLPWWVKPAKPLLKLAFYTTRFAYGTYRHKGTLAYEVFREDETAKRRRFVVENASYKWRD